MKAYRVYVEVVLCAKTAQQADERVGKALVCLENSLSYACAGVSLAEGIPTTDADADDGEDSKRKPKTGRPAPLVKDPTCVLCDAGEAHEC